MIVIEVIVALGVVGVMLALFQDCKRDIRDNEKNIEQNDLRFHDIDKKLDILISTLAIKYPAAVKRAKKDNGDKP
jgi:hypothetical protein